jgi:hypothetical protein
LCPAHSSAALRLCPFLSADAKDTEVKKDSSEQIVEVPWQLLSETSESVS